MDSNLADNITYGEILSSLALLIRKAKAELPTEFVIDGDSRFVEHLEFGSINSIMLASLVADAFKLDLSPHMNELMTMQRVGELVSFLVSQLSSSTS